MTRLAATTEALERVRGARRLLAAAVDGEMDSALALDGAAALLGAAETWLDRSA